MKKILLIGGTGAMGTHLGEILANDKDTSLYITSRRERQGRPGMEYLQGDSKNPDFIRSVIREHRFDAIVDFMVYNTKEFQAIHRDFLDNTPQYVFISSARVYSNRDKVITEETPRLLDTELPPEYASTDEYALTKARQENMLFDSGNNNWTIVRPYITYAENRMQLGVMEHVEWLYRALLKKPVLFSNDIASHKTTMTYGKDVARGISCIIAQEKALGEAFHITSGYALEWRRIAQIYGEAIREKTGEEPRFVYSDECLNLRYPQAKWQVMYDRLFDRVFDNSKISRFVDTSQFLKPEEGLRRCIDWFVDNGRFGQVDKIRHLETDILTKSRPRLSEFGSLPYALYYIYKRYITKRI